MERLTALTAWYLTFIHSIPIEPWVVEDEAIPERDPAYRSPEGTLYDGQTVEVMPADVRLTLARCLEELGMSAFRAALVVTL